MTLNSESALKVYLSARRGSAVPAAMTEDDLTQDEKCFGTVMCRSKKTDNTQAPPYKTRGNYLAKV
ncbi:unnamed protein product [Porites evermanni]|uniref:Uncharacterized protein n=1 Tax=Porites evermanni TaxID=104178 RepID=A0ABN8LML4_9CNID|nr:unnamed protein product [Porites evermanni]